MPKEDEEVAEMGLETPEDEDILEEIIVIEPTVVTLEDDLEMDLKALLGDEGFETLTEVAESGYKTLDEFVKVTVLDMPLGGIEVFNGKNRGPHNIVVLDTDGKPIDLSEVGLEDADKGYQGYSVGSLFETTVLAPGWSPSNLGSALVKVFEAKLTLGDLEANKRDHDAMLKQIRNSMTHLGDVFGFDDYEHLEMFFAAWLMQDSTCRLSGIPGTGKTTVIEAAAVLLCNSYGYNARPVYVAPTGRTFLTEDGKPDYEKLFGKDRAYFAQKYPSGQDYHLNYSNPAYADIHEGWDEWRFMDWRPPNGEIRSGSYLYDFEFLHITGTKDDEPFTKTPLKPEDFYRLLTNCYTAEVPVAGFTDPSAGKSVHVEGKELLAMLEEEQIHTVVAPIKLLNADGSKADFGKPLTYTVYDSSDKPHDFDMELRFPDVGVSATNELNYEWILSQGDPTDFLEPEWGLFTDAGRGEGYGFRQYLQQNFVDRRSKDARQSKNPDWKTILEEMMREQGIAKIDYEKRADEVLYGIEIQQSEKYDKLRDQRTSTYEFEPVPRPIVTQPIKFFNEANRSQSGVEDAILGLIAERKVEYRGKTFNSPHFVAWMDTNPHQKGNDLAFIDRIDMELLFKSISLGSRYTVLSDKYGGRGGLSPQEQLVSKLAEGGDVGFSAMRFRELERVWEFIISMIKYSPPGQATGTSTYDALREISYISVLFTQRFQPRYGELKSGTDVFSAKSGENFYESPLIDFSTTTNTNEEGKSQQQIPNEIKNTYKPHTPFNIERVLGFRFTNSLVKLSSALAFLRGKSYVHRKEILDGLPYVTAHRLGRAKSSKGEIQGLPGSLNFSNEQEWIREAIVNAYLLQDIDIGFSKGSMPIMDTWELYYRRCMDALKSAPALFWYEQQVLKPLHEKLRKGGSDVGSQMTPVHWHIATMVVDNERTASIDSATKPVRIYTHGDSENNNYKSNYNYYLTRVFSSPNPTKSPTDQTLADFFELRGDICAEPNLFSDDRDTLLDLLASTMATICGGPSISEVGNCSSKAIVSTKLQASKDQTTFGHDTTKFTWRTYQDSIGAWGRILQSPGTGGLSAVGNQFTASQVKGDGSAASFADQALMITGRMEVKKPAKKAVGVSSAGSLQRDMMVAQVQKLASKFGPDVSEGVIIKDTGIGSTEPMTFDNFMRYAQQIVADYPARDDFSDGQYEIGGITFDMMTNGLMACFPLKHTAGAPSGTGDFSGEDTLRLWVRLFQSDKSGKTQYTAGKKAVPFVTLNMTMGITSNLATKAEMLNVVPVNDTDKLAYTTSAYTKGYEGGPTAKNPDEQIQDSGNLSAIDMLNYQVAFTEAIKIETA